MQVLVLWFVVTSQGVNILHIGFKIVLRQLKNILLEATDQGLGTCWLGIYPKPERVSVVKEIYQIPESVTPLCIIAVGYPDEDKETKDGYDHSRVHINTYK